MKEMKNTFNLIIWALKISPYEITVCLNAVISPKYQRMQKSFQAGLDALTVFNESMKQFQSATGRLANVFTMIQKPLDVMYVRGLRIQWNVYYDVINSPSWR